MRLISTNAPMVHVSTVESVQMESIHTHAHVSQDMKVYDYDSFIIYYAQLQF